MKKIILFLLANGLALYAISLILEPNFVVTGGMLGYLIAGLIIGLVNAFVKPILKVLSLPAILLTAGLFSLVLNILMLVLSRYLLNVLELEGVSLQILTLPTYLYVALLLSLANIIIHRLK